jgi:hypothetical protein
MILLGDAVPQILWDFPLSAGLADFALAKFLALRRIKMLARRIELSRDGTRAPTQVRTGGRKAASHVIPFLRRSAPIFCPTNRVHLKEKKRESREAIMSDQVETSTQALPDSRRRTDY